MPIEIASRGTGSWGLLKIVGAVASSLFVGCAFGGAIHTVPVDEQDAVVVVKDTSYMDYPEWALLPKGIDLEDKREIAAIKQLIAEGEAAHEAMLAVVRDCDNLLATSCALSVLKQSQGDKRQVVEELKRLFSARLPMARGLDEMVRVTDIAAALADMGEDEDMDVLLPMLSHPGEEVRRLGVRHLGRRGGQHAFAALQTAKEVAKAHNRDREQKEIEEAISAIQGRLETKGICLDQMDGQKTEAGSQGPNPVH